ncbi:Putative motility protein [Paenibacillus tianmuensis]|uniref:Putative motility protein n=1 Tax=Paenibacillus tianmuensis TaxID=624147 RepID=A0A1G4SXU4_9BACL|nr:MULTISPECIES: YjfB family protein [Paenibacillus]MCP3774553.1 YjfB family protein [Paenibacillus sp. MZ04-78.2]SCW73757.1 Putative motility protein [Paenibacillus tianmuensis]
MQINAALNAISGGNPLKQAVGIALLSQMKDSQAAQAATMLQDFAAAQHPNLGKNLDIRV